MQVEGGRMRTVAKLKEGSEKRGKWEEGLLISWGGGTMETGSAIQRVG